MIGLIIEAPLEGNTEAFMHGEPKPDCSKNECIYSDKGFNGHMISYVFNANIVSRVRLWFYKIKTLNSDPDCTPYHFTIKSTPNYLETHNKEKVACMDEIFPAKITARRFAHKEISDTYIVEDYFRVDSFTDISFSADRMSETHKSSMIITKPSLVKVIISKVMHTFGYELSIFKIDGIASSLIYSTNNLKKRKMEIDSSDIRTSIMLPEGHYHLRIRAIMRGQDFTYSTCDSVKVYVGVTPTDQIKPAPLEMAQDKIPDLGFLLSNNKTINVALGDQEPILLKNDTGYVNKIDQIYSTKIKNLDSNGEIGLYLEIEENLHPSM